MSGYLVESVQSEAGGASAGEALLMRALPLTTNPKRRPLYGNGSIKYKNVQNKIHDVIFASTPNGQIENAYQNKTPIAQECMLAWCVRKYNSSSYLGNYEENIIETYLNTTGPGAHPFHFNDGNLTTSPDVYMGNATIETPAGEGTSLFAVSNVTMVRTINVFDDVFPSFYTAMNASDEPLLRCMTNDIAPRQRTLPMNPWASPNNITQHLERLAAALTDAIRTSSSSETVLGQAFSREPYVAVRWEWLTLPVSVVISSFIFLAATIFSSAGQQDIWKTSAIATLIYNLPDDTQKRIRSPTQTGTPQSRAMNLKVAL
jgi:hypothetical protein